MGESQAISWGLCPPLSSHATRNFGRGLCLGHTDIEEGKFQVVHAYVSCALGLWVFYVSVLMSVSRMSAVTCWHVGGLATCCLLLPAMLFPCHVSMLTSLSPFCSACHCHVLFPQSSEILMFFVSC